MSTLIALTYPDPSRTAEVMDTVRRLNTTALLDLEDALHLTKHAEGQVTLHLDPSKTGPGLVVGGMVGLLVGTLLFVPVGGAALGAGLGALLGHSTDGGIDESFRAALGEQLVPNSSAIFLLVREAALEEVVLELSQYGGTVLQTTLSPEAEALLQAALHQVAQQHLSEPASSRP